MLRDLPITRPFETHRLGSLPVLPPLSPMLARLVRDVPEGDYLYEPKWDGFRCLAFVGDAAVDLRSRHDRRLSRYFPEVVDALLAVGTRFVADGELVVEAASGFDFTALLSRLHPTPSRVARLARETPATFVAFDLLAEGDEDLRGLPFAERRARLERLLRGRSRCVTVTPTTADVRVARTWLARLVGGGVDGIVAKERSLTYRAGRRAMVKVKREHTADCVIAGMRLLPGAPAVASLLLGLYEGDALRHVGVASSFPEAARRALATELAPAVTSIEGHPWEHGFNIGRSPTGRLAGSAGRWDPASMTLDWLPLRPERVAEVAYDRLDAQRFRHPARFVRWRPDRDPRSCSFEQLPQAPARPPAVLRDSR